MDDRQIVSIQDEQSQSAIEREREAHLRFIQQWETTGEYPAYPIGLTLLRHFAEEYPDLYDHFVARNVSGHQSLPALSRNPKWVEYMHHWGTCGDCMETP